MIIDTHAHLDFPQFDSDRDSIIQRAKKSGVEYIINVGSSLEGSRRSVELASQHREIFASVGIHPHDTEAFDENTWHEIEKLASHEKTVAIGEVGLDYFKCKVSHERQKEVFVKFIEFSKKLSLPLVIHSREAGEDILDILCKNCSTSIKGVMHCFSGDTVLLNKVLELGLYVSFTCNLTFKNARALREVAKRVPHDRLLLETDAPFLALQAKRGQRNEPFYIVELRDMFSELLKMDKEEIERVTTENAKRLFGIPR